MRRKWRTTLATTLVIVFAFMVYVRNLPVPFDVAKLKIPFDRENPKLVDIPPPMRALDGTDVVVEGWMLPMDQAEHSRKFAITPPPQLGEFDMTLPPEVYQCVVANSQQGVDYIPDRVRVYGRLHVRLQYTEDLLESVFDLDADRVEYADPGPVARWPVGVVLGTGSIAAATLGWLFFRKRGRLLAGCCIACGYDLRATPDRCPECGLVPVY